MAKPSTSKKPVSRKPPRAATRFRRQRRVVIERVEPQVDGGPLSRSNGVTGDSVTVTADIHADGHDVVAAVVAHRRAGEALWREAPMQAIDNRSLAGHLSS